jgi:hypothetical protein
VLGHDGDTAGQRAFLRVFPDADAAVVVLTNSTKGTLVADDLLAAVGDAALGLTPPSLPEPLPAGEGPDPDRYTGIYERMHQRLAIAGGREGTLRMTIIPDDLFLLAGMRERTLTLQPVDDHRFVTDDPETGVRHLVVMIPDEDDDGRRPDPIRALRAPGPRPHRRLSGAAGAQRTSRSCTEKATRMARPHSRAAMMSRRVLTGRETIRPRPDGRSGRPYHLSCPPVVA